MKERPILFSGAMVRALLAGTKTQTRRVVKPQPTMVTDRRIEPWSGEPSTLMQLLEQSGKRCPYGQPGDRLWVRESFAHHIHAMGSDRDEDGPFVYAATDHPHLRIDDRWTPSIHMPRWASRITLEITGVRVERLQGISMEDAKAEGAWGPDESIVGKVAEHFGIDVLAVNPIKAYHMLWEQINGPGSWAANPWVWVVEFKRLEGGVA